MSNAERLRTQRILARASEMVAGVSDQSGLSSVNLPDAMVERLSRVQGTTRGFSTTTRIQGTPYFASRAGQAAAAIDPLIDLLNQIDREL